MNTFNKDNKYNFLVEDRKLFSKKLALMKHCGLYTGPKDVFEDNHNFDELNCDKELLDNLNTIRIEQNYLEELYKQNKLYIILYIIYYL